MDPPSFTNHATARGREEDVLVLSIVDVTGADLDRHITRLP